MPGPSSANGEEPVPPLPTHFVGNHMKRPSVKATRPDSDADPFHFDQVKTFNVQTEQLNGSGVTPSSSSSSIANAATTGSVRKSILKSWKGNGTSSNAPSPVQEIPIEPEKAKKRRPSVLDIATTSAKNMLKRNSRSSRSSVASASTINGAGALASTSRSTTPDPAMMLNDAHVVEGRPSLSGNENRPLKTPIRTNFDLPSPRVPNAPSSQGTWI